MFTLLQLRRRPTLIEMLTVIAIVAVLIALLTPEVKWASSGTIKIPVHVFVFDAENERPIADAEVTIFRASTITDSSSPEPGADRFHSRTREPWSTYADAVTNADGAAIIVYEFRTGANHDRPQSHAQLNWARVEAEGFGGVVVPIRAANVHCARDEGTAGPGWIGADQQMNRDSRVLLVN